MKTVIAILLSASIGVAGCNSNSNTSTADKEEPVDSTRSQPAGTEASAQGNAGINGVVSGYLQLKNALANDNGTDAATAARSMSDALNTVDVNRLSPEGKKVYEDVADDLKEHAEHIGGSAGKIAHQREHFETMSKDLYDLVKASGSERTLYKDFCPMYNNKKGGIWLSESRDIKNPYLGKQMHECGEVQEEIAKK